MVRRVTDLGRPDLDGIFTVEADIGVLVQLLAGVEQPDAQVLVEECRQAVPVAVVDPALARLAWPWPSQVRGPVAVRDFGRAHPSSSLARGGFA
jgi:hypothetical protein